TPGRWRLWAQDDGTVGKLGVGLRDGGCWTLDGGRWDTVTLEMVNVRLRDDWEAGRWTPGRCDNERWEVDAMTLEMVDVVTLEIVGWWRPTKRIKGGMVMESLWC
ncbi:zinc finger protein, partial [Sesbania bispinosa]